MLEHDLRPGADTLALAAVLAQGNPAPYAGVVRIPTRGIDVVTASPELFLRRSGDIVESGPIKGTAPTAGELLAKDTDENVMIVDLVRNDLSRVAEPGTVEVPSLLRVEEHPGLVHLVSTVRARLRAGAGWPELFAAAFPPGSVSGAPKSTALQAIHDLEPSPRGPYCGAIGWVDADRQRRRAGRRHPHVLGRRAPIVGCCASAPGPASPGARIRSWSGGRPSSRRLV